MNRNETEPNTRIPKQIKQKRHTMNTKKLLKHNQFPTTDTCNHKTVIVVHFFKPSTLLSAVFSLENRLIFNKSVKL